VRAATGPRHSSCLSPQQHTLARLSRRTHVSRTVLTPRWQPAASARSTAAATPPARSRAIPRESCTPRTGPATGHRLAKLRSPLEPQLRLQHFLALVAAGAAVEAIEYARRHLQPAGLPEAVAEEARRGMALLALGTRTSLPHASLLDLGRWRRAADRFGRDFLRLAGAPPTPPLVVALAAGVAALKTPFCSLPEHQAPSCPVCCGPIRGLATRLPSCQRSRSAVTCRLSGTLLDEDNPPLVLPSGHVYAEAAVLRLEAAHGGGAFRDPRTDDVVTMGSLRRAYFL